MTKVIVTQRQQQVLSCIAAGYSVRETAAGLHISEHTVRSHLKAAMSVLGARSIPHAVALACLVGIVRAKPRPR